MKELVLSMLTWIAAQTGWTLPNEMPVVITLNQDEINSVYHGRPISINMGMWNAHGTVINTNYPKCHWKECPGHVLDLVILVLSEDGVIDSDREKLTLLHELVHWLQFNNDHHHVMKCMSELEYKAYELQAQYMVDNGIKTHYGFDPAYIANVLPLHYPPCKG